MASAKKFDPSEWEPVPEAPVAFDPSEWESVPEQEVDSSALQYAKEYTHGSTQQVVKGGAKLTAGTGTMLQAPEAMLAEGLYGLNLARHKALNWATMDSAPDELKAERAANLEAARRDYALLSQGADAERTQNVASGRGLARTGEAMQRQGRGFAAHMDEQIKQDNPNMMRQMKDMESREGFWDTVHGYVTNPLGASGQIAESIPAMAAGVGVAGGTAKAINLLGATEKATMAATSLAGIGSEGTTAALQTRESTYQQVKALPQAELEKNSTYQEYRRYMDPDEAREALANNIAGQTVGVTALATMAGGKLANKMLGEDVTAAALTRSLNQQGQKVTLGKAVKRGLGEGFEEGMQSPADMYQQVTAGEVDPNSKLDISGTLAGNMLAGVHMGVPMHGYTYLKDRASKGLVPNAPVDLLNPAPPADAGAPPAAGGLTSEQARQEAEQAAWEAEQAAMPPEVAVTEQAAPAAPVPEAVPPANAAPTQDGLSMPTAEEQAQAAAKEQEAAKLEEEHKQVQAETVKAYGTAPIVADGQEIGVTFGGKQYYHGENGAPDPKLDEAVNSVIKAEMEARQLTPDPKAHALREAVIESIKESGVVPAGRATPASVTAAISKLNLTPANAVTVLKHELKMLEEKKGKGDIAKKGFYENLLGRLGGGVVPVQGEQNAVQVGSPAQEDARPAVGGENIVGDISGVGQEVQGAEVAGAGQVKAEAQVDRRALDERRAERYASMTPEELRAELEAKDRRILTDHMTGIPNRAAYDEAIADAKAQGKPAPLHIFADIDNLKQINSEYGNEGGDEAIRAFAKAQHMVDARSFRLGGDEFVGLAESQEEADDRMSKVREILDQAVITYTLPDGTVRTKKGIGFSYGTGESIKAADAAGKKDKAARAAKGLRFERDVADRMVEDNAKGREVEDKPTRGEEVKAKAAEKAGAETPATYDKNRRWKFPSQPAPAPKKESVSTKIKAKVKAVRAPSEPVPFAELPENMKVVVADYMGLDENGDVDMMAELLSTRELAKEHGSSHTTWATRLKDLGYDGAVQEAEALRRRQDVAAEAVTDETSPFGEADESAGVEASPEDEVVEKVAPAALPVMGGDTATGKGWETAIQGDIRKATEAQLAEAASKDLPDDLADKVTDEFIRRAKAFGKAPATEATDKEKARRADELKAKETAEVLEKQAAEIEKQLPREITDLASQIWSAYTGSKISTLTAVQRNDYVRRVASAKERAEDGASMQMYMDNAHKSFVELNKLEVPNGQVEAVEEAGAVSEGVRAADAGRAEGSKQVAATVVTKKSRAKSVKRSAGEVPTTASSEAKIRAAAEELLGSVKAVDDHIVFVTDPDTQIPAEAKKSIETEERKSGEDSTVAFVYDGKMYVYPDRVMEGDERGIILHEVGVHLGLEKLVGKSNVTALANQIRQWASGRGNAEEVSIARKVAKSIRQADVHPAHADEEYVAYFVQHAVEAGHTPGEKAGARSSVGRWLNRLWESMKQAVAKLGVNPSSLTAQEVVDLAHAAAATFVTRSDKATLTDVFASLTEVENSAQYPKSDKTNMQDIATELDPALEVEHVGVSPEYHVEEGVRKIRDKWDNWRLKTKDGKAVYITANLVDKTVKINVGDLREGASNGALIYQLVGQWAANNEFVFVGDDQGLSNTAMFRRLESMISLAIKNGTTEFMQPHPDQLEKTDGQRKDDPNFFWPGMKWALGDDVGNLQSMLEAAYTAVSHHVPEVKNVIFDTTTGTFTNTRTGQEFTDLDFDTLAGTRGARTSHAGSTTLKRAALVNSVLQGKISKAEWGASIDRHNEVAARSNDGGQPLDEIRYAKAPIGSEKDTTYANQEAAKKAYPHAVAAGYTMTKRVVNPDGSVTITWKKGVAPAKSVNPASKPKSAPAPTPVPAATAPATVAPQSPTASQWVESGGVMSKFLRNPVTNFATNVGSGLKTHGLGWLSIDHLVEAGSNVNSKLNLYQDVSRKMQSMSKARVAQAAAIDAEWGKLDSSESAPLHDIMRASTRAGFDPSKGIAPANADETKIQTAYDELAAKSPEAIKVFVKARDHYASVRAERKAISVSLLRAAHAGVIDRARETGDPAKLQSAENDLEKLVNSLEEKYNSVKGPYFPLMRLGDWYTVAKSSVLRKMEAIENPSAAERKRIAALRKDGNHYTTSAYDSKSAAVEAQKKLEQRFGKGNVTFNMAEEKNYAAEVLSSSGMEKVEAYINSSFDKEIAGEIRDMMADLYYDALPEHHALKHEMRREGVHGEETDMRRVFAVSSLKSAHYVSRLKYADQLKAAMFAIQKEGKERGFQSTRYYNEIAKRAKLSMNSESNPVIDKLITASYLHHLGANPAFILQNATQVAMVTMPWLAARTSSVKASAAIARAYGTAGSMIKSSYKEQGWRFELDWENKVSKDVGKMLTTLLERNLLDITIEHDLGATAQLKSHVIGDALRFINLPVHVTELANRTVTALAAYELAVTEKKMSHDEAVDFAAKAVSTTQLDYSALNAPRHMQRVLGSAPIAKLMMQFRKYQQGMLWIIGRSIHQSVVGESPEVRREARRTVFGLATTTGVMAGSLGLPMAGSALWALSLVASLFGEDDDPWDAAVEYENWLSETMGKEAASLFARGLPAYVLGIDLSKRLGLGDIANPLSFAKEEKDMRSQVGSYMTAAAGAPTGTVIDIFEGLGMASEGDWAKGVEKFAPLKVIQNLVRSSRFALEGMTSRDGAVVLPPDEFTPWDITVKAVGFGTDKEARYYHDTGAKAGAKSVAMDGRKKLLDKYTTARMAGEDTTSVMEDIQAFNERHPEKGVRIDRSSRQKSLVARRNLTKSRVESGVSVGKKDKPFMENTAYSE